MIAPTTIADMPIIAVTSMKGGVGKTTIALGLASAAQAAGDRVLVIDLDPQGNATMGLAVDDPDFTIGDALADARPGIAAHAVTATPWGPKVDLIAADRSLEHRNAVEGARSHERLRTSLASLPLAYDVVIIDCPPSLGELTRNALQAASEVVVVTEPGYFSLRGAQQAVEAAELAGRAGQRITIVLNRVRTTVAEHRNRIAELQEHYGSRVNEVLVPERNAIAQSEGAGVGIHDWDSPAGKELSGLFDRLYASLIHRPGRSLR